jgi:hypothetical protein
VRKGCDLESHRQVEGKILEEIPVDFQWDRAEFLRVTRNAIGARMYRSMLLSSIGFIACGLGTLFVGFSGFSAFFFVLGLLYFGMALWFRIDVPIRAWNKRLELHSPIHLAFNDDGVITQTVDSESKIPWRNYPYSKEWSDYYLIQRSRRSGARVVPKRGFHSKDDEAHFRELLESKTMFVPQGGSWLSNTEPS